ncbi:carcinine hydrolase/isopenicillin-N N-acyltransferase family protein [Sporomusa sp.]|uniref:carcinine hydrolase/isopenicillin-N N-acyltransferase family protein n=1 Tax=Sporomusa sp. TaxID=2078658 RepID=UPI002D7FA094|nr:carcinine hydrolase/isopenicillin-N N-acyltransferase family protein [Sporomusa sp.]
MCTLGAIYGKYLFKNRDMEPGAGLAEDLLRGHGRYRYIGVAGHASPLERGLNSGINQAGVAVAMTFADYTPLTEVIKIRTPRGVLIEDILRSAGNLADALRIAGDCLLTTPLVGGNIVIMTPEGGAVIEQLYPNYAVQLITQPVTVRTNHFLNLAVPGKLAVNEENSKIRLARCTRLLVSAAVPEQPLTEGFSVERISQVLANHEEPHPICRHGGDAQTVSTAIYDIENRAMHYVYGNPCDHPLAHYTV